MAISVDINIWAVLVASIVSMIIGSIWYGPLFGKLYMKCLDMDSWSEEKKAEMKKAMMKSYTGQFIASVVSFYVLAWLIGGLHMIGFMGGFQAAFWVWLGFIVPMKFGDALWGGKMTMFWLSAGSSFFIFAIGGMIIGAWM
ncbi:DUF1761 domain-containing protein [Patescibacteria group bacterium]|nr:DUF1761 domain-containing protein [Patescibacteria group bacterium]